MISPQKHGTESPLDLVAQSLDHRINRRTLGKVAAAGALALSPIGGAMAQSTPEAAAPVDRPRGGSVTYAQIGDPDSLDPQVYGLYLGTIFFTNLYDTLVGQAMDLSYEGILAESWDISEDGLEYTFKLRQGISFHNGEVMNAAAVKFSFDRVIDPALASPVATNLGPLKETVVIDDYTVKLVLSEPHAPMMTALCAPWGAAILPPGAVQADPIAFGKNPVGTGPFKFKEWNSGSSIILVPNENYQNFHSYFENPGAPYLDELIVSVIPDAATQVVAFQTGQVQVIDLPEAQANEFKDDPDAQVFVTPGGRGLDYVSFTTVEIPEGQFGAAWKAPFDDLRVRQAVAHAIDADAIVKSVLFGLATRLYGPMPVGITGYRPDIEQFGYHYDPEKSKALLEEAGWVEGNDGVREKDGNRLELLMGGWNEDIRVRCIQVLQNQLDQVGFKINVQLFDPATFIADVSANNVFNLDFSASGANDPSFLDGLVHGTYSTLQYYQDEALIDLLDEGTRTVDPAKRSDIYFEAQKNILAACAMVPLWAKSTARGVRVEAKGYVPGPQGWGYYQDMYFED